MDILNRRQGGVLERIPLRFSKIGTRVKKPIEKDRRFLRFRYRANFRLNHLIDSAVFRQSEFEAFRTGRLLGGNRFVSKSTFDAEFALRNVLTGYT